MGGGGQQMMGQVAQATQNNVSQGSPTMPSSSPAGNAYASPNPFPSQSYYSGSSPFQQQQRPFQQQSQQQPLPQQQPSWQQNSEWQGYQSQMQDLQNKMQTYQRQYQPQQQPQQQNDYRPRSGYGGGGFGQSQNAGLAGLIGSLGLGGGFGGGYGGGSFSPGNSYDPYMNMPDFASSSPSFGQGASYDNGGKVE